MNNIFNAIDRLVMKQHHAKSIMFILPALMRVLYSTGMRIGEALSILNKDVDFERHVIILNNTKNRCQRLAPINESLECVLKQYIIYRNRIPVVNVANPDSHLFVSTTGKPCNRGKVLTYFHRILDACGIPRCCDQRGPRLHDVRHTSCIHSLIKLTMKGGEFYNLLPLLAAFMGHKKVLDTENYLRLTKEAYPEILNINTEVSSEIFSTLTSKLTTVYEKGID
jgi:site-specific recombinase XerD